MSPSTMIKNTARLGHSCASGATPLLGNPGMVLPVTVDEAESLLPFGSAGVLEVRVATLVAGLVPFTVTVI